MMPPGQHLGQPTVSAAPVPRAQQVGLRESLAIIIRRHRVILGIALPIIVVATIGTLRSSNAVTAGARVVIEGRQAENPTFSNVSVDYDVLMSTSAQVAMSIPVAERAATALLDSMAVFKGADPALAGISTMTDLRSVLLKGVDCSQVGESNILSITFTHENSRFALMAVAALTEAYIEFSIESQQNRSAVSYYTDQIDRVQAGMDSLMALRAGILNETGYFSLGSDVSLGVNQIKYLEQEYFKARARRMGLEASLRGLEQAIADDPDYVPGLRGNENANLVGLKSRVDEIRATIAELLVTYNDDSEWVARQKQLLEEARSELQLERGRYVRDLRISLGEASSTEESLRESMEGQRARLALYPAVEHRVGALDLQISTQRELLESLQMKRGEVHLKTDSDQRISSIVPLDEPSIELRVGQSKKALYFVMASVFAVVLGFVGALFAEGQDHRLHDRRQAEQYLELPVLGAISTGDRNEK